VPADRLHGAHFDGKVVATPDHLGLEAGKLQIDTSNADIAIGLQRGERPVLDVAFDVDMLNLDAYRSKSDSVSSSAPVVESSAPTPAPPAHQNGDFAGFGGFDVRAKGTLGQVLFHGVNNKNVTLDGRWGADGESLAGEAHLDAGGLSLAVAGHTSAGGVAPYDLRWDVHHASFVQMVHLFAPDYRPAGTLGTFSASGNTRGDFSTLDIHDLKLSVGAVVASGQAKLDLKARRPQVDASLSFGEVPLDGFFAARIASGSPAANPPNAKHLPATSTPPVPQEAPASEGMDFAWLSAVDGTLKLDAEAVSLGVSHIATPHVTLTLKDGSAKATLADGQLYGGTIAGMATLDAGGAIAAQASLIHAQFKRALTDWSGFDVADGTMDAVLDVTANGHTRSDWTRSLAGHGTLHVHDGQISGFNLKAVDDKLRNLDANGGLLGVLTAGFNGGKTTFSALSGSLHIDKGVVTNTDLSLQADGGGADGAFQIDLPASTIDGHLGFHLTHAQDAPPLVLRIAGPLNAPRRFLDINQIQAWLIQHAVGQGGKPKDILKKLFGH
jgi:hypothetical protein